MRAAHFLGILGIGGVPIAAWQSPIGPASAPSEPSTPSYRDSLLALHESLVSTPSVTGTEGAVGQVLLDHLAARSYSTRVQPLPALNNTLPGAGRFNIIAWPSSDPDDAADRPTRPPRVLVTSHIDVVPPHIPYYRGDADGDTDANTLIGGRGSVDAKASVAAQIVALDELLAAGEVGRGDVALLFVGGEETTGDGMRAFSTARAELGFGGDDGIEAVVFGEPTENRLACGHKGHVACRVAATGRAGHSGYPWLGKSATEVLLRALVRILDTDLGSSSRFGATTVNVGRIEGGVAANVIADRATAAIAVRIAAGNQQSGFGLVRSRIQDLLAATDDEALSLECENGYGPIECECDVEGFDTMIANYGTDAANLDGNHIKYLYGPGSILVAHGDDEALRVLDLEASVEGYKKLIKHALRQPVGELRR